MKYENLHRWDLPPAEAIALQKELAGNCVLGPIDLSSVRLVAGVDVSVKSSRSKAAIVVLSFPELEKVETVVSITKTSFAYIPGLLSFREGPVILECVEKLKTEPDIFIFDGQGMAHPRKIGIASHMGLILKKPSIGSAKSHLFGKYDEPGQKRGDLSYLKDNSGEKIGAVLRTRDGITPIFVSPGHLADIDSSVEMMLACTTKYRLPEPIRAAHNAASLVNG